MVIKKWKKVKSEIEFSNERIVIRKDKFLLPNGKLVDYSVLDRGVVVAVLPITNEGNIVLVEQYRPPVDDITVDIPGGRVHTWENEKPEESALRELKEETGYEAGKLALLGTFYPDSGRSDQLRYIFVAEELKKGAQKLDELEDIIVKEEPLNEVMKKIAVGDYKETTLVLACMLLQIKDSILNKQT